MMDKPDYFPDIWNDDERMAVLFSPFRERSLNPSSWDKKMSFWTDIISSDSRNCGNLFIDLTLLPKRYERKGKLPACLTQVIQEMERSGNLTNLKNVKISTMVADNKGWLTWGFDTFVKSPVSWGWNYVKSKKSPSEDKYVVLEVLKDKCSKVCESHYLTVECEITDSVVEFNELWDKNRAVCRTEEEFKIVVQQLIKDKKIAIHQTETQLLVKFGSRDTTAGQVSEQDLNVYRLKKACSVLMSRIDKLEHDADRLTVDAKMYKRKDMKQYALRCLRQRRRLQNRVDKLMGSLDTLDDVLGRIRHAVSDEVVLKAIQSGTDTLKSLTDKVSLDEVTATMDDLGEVLDQQNEVEAELSMDSSRLDSSELERELNDLIQDEVVKDTGQGEDASNKATGQIKSDVQDVEDFADMFSKVNLSDTSPAIHDTLDQLDKLEFPEVPKFLPEAVHHSTPKTMKTSAPTKVKELAS